MGMGGSVAVVSRDSLGSGLKWYLEPRGAICVCGLDGSNTSGIFHLGRSGNRRDLGGYGERFGWWVVGGGFWVCDSGLYSEGRTI